MNKMSNKNIHIRKGDMRGEGQTLMSLLCKVTHGVLRTLLHKSLSYTHVSARPLPLIVIKTILKMMITIIIITIGLIYLF